MNNQFIKDIANLYDAAVNTVDENFMLRDGDEWESITFLATLALADEHFGVCLKIELLKEVKYFGELEQLIADTATVARGYINYEDGLMAAS